MPHKHSLVLRRLRYQRALRKGYVKSPYPVGSLPSSDYVRDLPLSLRKQFAINCNIAVTAIACHMVFNHFVGPSNCLGKVYQHMRGAVDPLLVTGLRRLHRVYNAMRHSPCAGAYMPVTSMFLWRFVRCIKEAYSGGDMGTLFGAQAIYMIQRRFLRVPETRDEGLPLEILRQDRDMPAVTQVVLPEERMKMCAMPPGDPPSDHRCVSCQRNNFLLNQTRAESIGIVWTEYARHPDGLQTCMFCKMAQKSVVTRAQVLDGVLGSKPDIQAILRQLGSSDRTFTMNSETMYWVTDIENFTPEAASPDDDDGSAHRAFLEAVFSQLNARLSSIQTSMDRTASHFSGSDLPRGENGLP